MAPDDTRPSKLEPGQVKFTCPCGKRIITPGPGMKILCPRCGKALRSPGEAKPSEQRPARRASRRKTDIMALAVGVLGVAAVAAVVAALAFRVKDDIGQRREAEEHKRNQDAVSEFEQTLLSTQQLGASAMKGCHESFEELASGHSPALEVRAAADSAAQKYREACQAVMETEVPEGLPEDVSALLYDARDAMLESYETKEKALGLAVECLNRPTPSNLHKLEQDMRGSESAIAGAAAKLGEARKKMGITK